MNRKLTLLLSAPLFFLLTGLTAMAQKDSNTGIDIVSLNKRIFEDPSDSAIESKLRELALKSPQYMASTHQIKINELDLKRIKSSWLNFLTISTSYNDQSFSKQQQNPQTPVVYPKYYFTLGIPLGIIFSQGKQVKTSREAVAQGKNNQEELARAITTDIIAKYKQYKVFEALIEIQSELINDVMVTADQAEANFRKGTITVETYLNTRRTANDELTKNVNQKLQQELLKLEMERIIGVPLESVLHPNATTNK